MNSRTAGSATSASSSAMRTSRSISAVFASVRRASPRMVLTTLARRWVRLSSMESVLYRMGKGGPASGGRDRHFTRCRRSGIRHSRRGRRLPVTWCKLARCKTPLFYLAALIYATAPSCRPAIARRFRPGTLLDGWLHGGALWADMVLPGCLRLGFAIMLSATLWISVAAYWLENRNFSLDSLRRAGDALRRRGSRAAGAVPGQPGGSCRAAPAFGWHIAVAILAYSTADHRRLPRGADGRCRKRSLHTRAGRPAGWLGGDARPAAGPADHGKAAVPPDLHRLRRC